MFCLIKQVFVVLLGFSSSLAHDQIKCLFLNDKPCLVRPTVIDLNSVEVKHYPFMISLEEVLEVIISYPQKYVFLKKQKT